MTVKRNFPLVPAMVSSALESCVRDFRSAPLGVSKAPAAFGLLLVNVVPVTTPVTVTGSAKAHWVRAAAQQAKNSAPIRRKRAIILVFTARRCKVPLAGKFHRTA